MKTALITGSAGFIGYHLAERWLAEGWRVVGVDSFSDYYDPALKRARSERLHRSEDYLEVEGKIETPGLLAGLIAEHRPERVLHLAAQAGVRHSIEAPKTYVEANLLGTFELLEATRAYPPAHMLLASTSSVYGANKEMPYAEDQKADTQMSFYAATKKACEAMAHSYAHLYDLPVTMFRFFTVYGPWGRPDMAPMLFAEAMLNDRPIKVFNHGRMKRDFTFVDDLCEAVWRLSDAVPAVAGEGVSDVAPFRVVNIGKSEPDPLFDFIEEIEKALGKKAQRQLMDMQPGDVPATWADTGLLERVTGYTPDTPLSKGIPAFADWYLGYFNS